MPKPLFHTLCTTCQARLAVRDESAIGAILICPKCQSFVEVAPPPDWTPASPTSPSAERPGPSSSREPPSEAPVAAPGRPEDSARTSQSAGTDNPARAEPGAPPNRPGASQDSTRRDTSQQSAPAVAESSGQPTATPALADTVEDFPELERPVAERSERAQAAARVLPPPLPKSPPSDQPAEAGAAALAPLGSATAPLGGSGPLPPPSAWVSPAEALWRKWLILIMAPIVGLVLAGALVSMLLSGRQNPSPEEETVVKEAGATPAESPVEKPDKVSLPQRLDMRWIPDRTRFIFALRPMRLAAQPEVDRVGALAPAVPQAANGLLAHLGLEPQDVVRLYWSAVDLNDWAHEAVAVIELAEGLDAEALVADGQQTGLRLEGSAGRLLPGDAWPHPVVAIHARLLVTGEAGLLDDLAQRSESPLKSQPLRRLIDGIGPDFDAAVILDLAAARSAGWKLPVALLDVWPEGREPWRVLWEMPQGAAVALRMDDRVRSELALLCEAETAADKVLAAVEALLPAAQTAVAGQLGSLAAKVESGSLKAELANRYEALLSQAQAGLKAARVEATGEAVWVRVQWPRSFADLAEAGLRSRAAARAAWLEAARTADEVKQRRLLQGLGAYASAEGSWPPGAEGGRLFDPETRLSWIATTLPYLGHRDWHSQLEFGYDWNSPRNRMITRRPLEEAINPALGPAETEAGFPVTHYVGVAGVGEGAGKLPADDPRAGVFGFGRSTGLDDIPDGASNTLAILGVSKRLGAWGSGGDPTVRALTRPPYVNGPDGFGSGQPDGMLAGMVDGSVRFISKDVDPRVLELMATARGGEAFDLAMIEPRRAAVGPKPHGPGVDVPRPKPAPKPGTVPEPVAVEPVEIDVRERLKDRLAALELADVPLSEAIGLLESFSTLRITLDLEQMDLLGVRPDDPIRVKLTDVTVAEALEAVLARCGMVHVVEGDYVLATRPAAQREAIRTVRYDVSDLVAGEDEGPAERLAQLVVSLVVPHSWQAAGGKGAIQVLDDILVVQHTDLVHREVLRFLEKLRSARGMPSRSTMDPAEYALVSRATRAQARLDRPVTANFVRPTPLDEILSYLEQISETTLLVDWITLGKGGVPPNVQGVLSADGQPLREALRSLLQPLGLTYRVAHAGTLQITTRKAAGARLDLEFYRTSGLIDPDQPAGPLVEQIKSQVAGGSWSDAGGTGVIHADQASRCLLVLQTQSVHREIESCLARLRAEKGATRGDGG